MITLKHNYWGRVCAGVNKHNTRGVYKFSKRYIYKDKDKHDAIRESEGENKPEEELQEGKNEHNIIGTREIREDKSHIRLHNQSHHQHSKPFHQSHQILNKSLHHQSHSITKPHDIPRDEELPDSKNKLHYEEEPHEVDDKQQEMKEAERHTKIDHASKLLGEALIADKTKQDGIGITTGNTTIHHQHVLYKNKESHDDHRFNQFFKYASIIAFSIIVIVDLLSESRSNKVSSVYVAIREKKPDIRVFGRDQEIAAMRKAFYSPLPSTWFITGPGGCGKSDLVRHIINAHPFSLYLNVREFIGKEVNTAVVVERFNDVIGLPNKGLFASILVWTGRGSEPIASSQFADSLNILSEALSLIHQPEKIGTMMKYFIRVKSIGRELNALPDPTKPTPCPIVVMDEGQVLSSPMLAAQEGAPMLLMAALAAVTSVDNGVAHFVIVSNEATKLRQLLKETSTLNSVWVREMSIPDMTQQEAHGFVLEFLNRNRFGIMQAEVDRKADMIVDNFGGRIGDLNTILSIHTLEGVPIEEAIQSLYNVRFHDLAEVLSSVPNDGEATSLKFLKKVIETGTISHREAMRTISTNVLHYLIKEGLIHRFLVPNSQYPDVKDLPFYIVGSKFTQRILTEKFIICNVDAVTSVL